MGRRRLRLDGEDLPDAVTRPRERRAPRTPLKRAPMTIQLGQGRPNDERRFIHKKLLGIGASLAGNIPGIGTAINVARGAIRTFGRGAQSRSNRFVPRTQTARPSRFSEAEKELGRRVKFADAAPPPIALITGGGGGPLW